MARSWEKWLIIPQGHAAVQRNLDRLEMWAEKDLLLFSREKC